MAAVELGPPLMRRAIAPSDLPPAGQSGFDEAMIGKMLGMAMDSGPDRRLSGTAQTGPGPGIGDRWPRTALG